MRSRARSRVAGGRSQTLWPSTRSTMSLIRRPPTCRERCRTPLTPLRRRARRHGSFRKAVLDEDFDRAHAVTPADLLALRAAARVEVDGQLKNLMTGAQQLRGDFRLDVEPV